MAALPHTQAGFGSSAIGIDGLRWFVLAADAGSLTHAARKSNVAQSTVSRALLRLEVALGLELVVRNGRSFRLSEAGERLLPVAREVLADIEGLARLAGEAREGVFGLVRLSLCTTLGRHVLLPKLMEWCSARRQVRLDIRLEERDVDPRTDGLDVVVRAGRPRDSDVRRTMLGDYGHVLVASPEYASRRGLPNDPSELKDHDVLAMRLERVWSSWPFRRARESMSVEVVPKVVLTDADALSELVAKGHGLTVLPDYVAEPELARGRQIRVLPAWTLPRIPVYAFHSPSKRLSRVVAEVLEVSKRALQERTR